MKLSVRRRVISDSSKQGSKVRGHGFTSQFGYKIKLKLRLWVKLNVASK